MIKTKFNVRFMSLLLAVITIFGIAPFAFSTTAFASGIYPYWAQGYTLNAITVYESDGVTVKGSLSACEGFTAMGEEYGLLYIQYSSASGVNGTKDGYIKLNSGYIIDFDQSTVAIVQSNQTLYYGTDTAINPVAGYVSAKEYVTVLGTNSSWAYVEFNTANGRKRGYINKSALTIFSTQANINGLPIERYGLSQDYAPKSATVYGGPGKGYAAIGSVSAGEGISVIRKATIGSTTYWFFEYLVDGTNQRKSGYIII